MKQKLESLKGKITDEQLAEIIRRAEYRKNECNMPEPLNISQIDYELDHSANYKVSEGRK